MLFFELEKRIPMNTQKPELYAGSTPVKPFYLPKRTLQEQSRLTFQHHALRTVMAGNFLAPVPHPTAILDVVCGSGAWTAEMAKLFPEAEVVGLDVVKPICPQPSHVQFIEGRSPLALPFNDERFEYVHQRCLSPIIPTEHWQHMVNGLVRVTKPLGWIELMEYGSYTNAGPATQQFCLCWKEAKKKQGIDLLATEHLEELLRNAGLIQVQQKTFPIPLYGEGRATGAMVTNLLAMIRSAEESILTLGMDHSAFGHVVNALQNEWLEHKTTYQFYVAYGQRPSTFFHASQRSNTKTAFIQQR
jgi:ubiquinone/menaquinone biosynthesis C-methylase UbiE